MARSFVWRARRGSVAAVAGILVLLGLATAPVHAAGAATCGVSYVWDGSVGSGLWTDAANWTPAGVPGLGVNDCATISGAEVDLTASETLLNLTVTSSTVNDPPPASTGFLTATGTTTSHGTSVIWTPFTNSGTMSVPDGTLTMEEGAGGGGAFGATGTGLLQFAGPCDTCPPAVLTNGASFTGGVSIGVNNGALPPEVSYLSVAAGATVTSDNDNTLYASVIGGTGTFEVKTGTFHWTSDAQGAAKMRDAGTTVVDVGATLAVDGVPDPSPDCPMTGGCGGVNFGNSDVQSPNRTIINNGTTVLSNGGFIAADGGTTFENCGTFQIDNFLGYYQGVGTDIYPETFTDCGGRVGGKVEKTGGDPSLTSIIDATFPSGNPGPIVVDVGALALFGSNLSTTTVAASAAVSTGSTVQNQPNQVQLSLKDFASAVTNESPSGIAGLSVVESSSPPSVPVGYDPLAYSVSAQTPSLPSGPTVTLALAIDSSQLAAGDGATTLRLVNKGKLVPACYVPGVASPDPCITATATLPDGDVQLTMLSSSIGTLSPEIGRCCLFGPTRAHAQTVSVSDAGYSPVARSQQPGGLISWSFTQGTHTATDALNIGGAGTPVPLFDSHPQGVGSTYLYSFLAAGTYTVLDQLSSHTGSVQVPVLTSATRGSLTSSFTITWATSLLPDCSACAFQVQYRFRPQGGNWQNWRTWGAPTRTTVDAAFTADQGVGSYQFRARLKNTSTGKASGYSPASTTIVIQ